VRVAGLKPTAWSLRRAGTPCRAGGSSGGGRLGQNTRTCSRHSLSVPFYGSPWRWVNRSNA
jgi:hypothetical protein